MEPKKTAYLTLSNKPCRGVTIADIRFDRLLHVNNSMPPFKHTPLISPHAEMRLLKLYLLGPDDDIRCEISPYVISSAPVYTALSYEWGESTLNVEILVNGRISQRDITFLTPYEGDCSAEMLELLSRQVNSFMDRCSLH